MGETTELTTFTEDPPANLEGAICGGRKRGTYDPETDTWEYCQSPFLFPNGRCRLHGGMVKKGPDHPNWKYGKWSVVLPPNLRERAEEYLNDPELVSVRRQLALCSVRQEQLLERLNHKENGQLYASLSETLQLMDRYRRMDKPVDVDRLAQQALKLCEEGLGQDRTWADLDKLFETQRRLADTEQRILTQKQQFLSTLEAYSIIDAIVQGAVQLLETDHQRNQLAHIVDDILTRKPKAGAVLLA